MTTESSSLIFGVRTTEAVANLEILQRELDKTLAKFAAVQSAQGSRGYVGSTNEAAQATRTAAAEMRHLGNQADRTSRQMVSYGQRIGGAFVPFRLELTATNSALLEQQKLVQRIASDPTTAIGLSKQRAEYLRSVRETSKIWEEQAKIRASQAQKGLAAVEAAEAASRQRTLSALKADILERSAIQAQADAAHAKHLENQARLAMKYDAMTLNSRIRTLEQINRLQMRGYSAGRLITGYGETAFADLANLTAYRQQAEAIKATSQAEADLAKVRREGTGAVDRSTNALARNTNLMRETHSVARGLSGSLGALWMTYGAILPLLGGAVAGGLASQTYTTGRDIEYRLKMLEALGNQAAKVGDLMEAVHGSMRTPLEAAEGLQELAQAGLSTTEALAALGPTLQLATLGSMSVADAALTTTAALATFNLEAYEAGRVGDVFAKGASISNASVENLAEAMKQAGAAAATYGLTVEETVAQLAALAQAGIRGTAAGTAVKNAMTELYAPTKKASEMMKLINLEIFDADGNARNYLDILKDLKGATSVLTEEQENLLLKGMFNERSRRAIQIYMNDMGRLVQMNEDLADSTGYLERANRMLLDTVEGASNRLQSVLQQSYVKAFQELNPLIRETILSLEQFVAGDGFVEGVRTLGSLVSTLTSFLAENIGVITEVLKWYALYRGAVLATTMAITAYNSGAAAKAAATSAVSLALGRNTQAMAANSAASNTAALAQGVLAGNLSASRAAASAAAIAFTNLNRALGIIGVALSAASLAMYTFSRDSDASAKSSRTAGSAAEAAAAQIKSETAAILARRRARLLELGVTDSSVEKDLSLRRQRLRDGELEAQLLQEQVERARAGLTEASVWELRTDPGGRARAYRAAEEALAEHNKKMKEQADELADIEKTLAEGPAILQTGRMETSLINLIGDIDRAAQEITYRGAEHSSNAMAPALASLREQAEGYLSAISDGTPVAQHQVDGLSKAYWGLNQAISQTLQGSLGLTPDDGGGGVPPAIRHLNETFNHQKRLLGDMRDFRLKMLEDERKAGVRNESETALEREKIWADYQEKLVAAAQKAQAQMSASGAKEAAKELGARSIAMKVAHERERAEAELTMAHEKALMENRLKALKAFYSTGNDLRKIEREIVKETEKLQREHMKQFMSARQLAQLEARNAIEEKYNRELEERNRLWDEGMTRNPAFASSEEGQKLAESIRQIAEASNLAGESAANLADKLYTQTNSATAGAIRALQQYADEAMNAGSQVEQAFSRAFSTLEDQLVSFLRTGQTSFRSLIDGIRDDMARLVTRQYITGPLANMMGGMIGAPGQQGGGGFSLPTSFNSASLSKGIEWVGQQIGSESLLNFSAGLSGNLGSGGVATVDLIKGTVTGGTAASGSFAGKAGDWLGKNGGTVLSAASAIYDISEGNYGRAAGTVLGSFLPIPGGSIIGSTIGGFVDSIFGDREPTTRRGQRSTTQLLGGSFQLTDTDSRQDQATQEAARKFAEEAVKSANTLFQDIGINASIESFWAIMESSIKGDRQGVASGGSLMIDDIVRDIGVAWASDMTIRGFGGWSEAEMFPRLQTDIQLTLLEAFQVTQDHLPRLLSNLLSGVNIRELGAEESAALAQTFSGLVAQINTLREAADKLPFEQLRNLTFELSANLIEYAGGMEVLDAGLTSYYQNFYSQEEKIAWTTEQLSKAFTQLGTVMPELGEGSAKAHQLFRDLVEAQDLTTESGQRTYSGLMVLSGGFSELAKGVEELQGGISGLTDEMRELQTLERRIMELTGDVAGIRKLELEALYASNRPLQERIWALEDEADAVARTTQSIQALVSSANSTLQARNTAGGLMDQLGSQMGLGPVFAPRREAELWSTLRATAKLTREIAYLQAYPDLTLAYRQNNYGMDQSAWANWHFQEYGQGEGRFFGPNYAKQIEMAQELSRIVETRIQEEQRAVEQQISNYSRIRDIARSLQDYLRSLESSELAPYTLREKVGNAEAELVRLVTQARSGDETALGNVQSALQHALSLWREYGASGSDYQAAYHRLTGMVGDLAYSALSESERQIQHLSSINQISGEQYALLSELYAITQKATEGLDEQYRGELAAMGNQVKAIEALGMDTQRLHDIAASLQGLPGMIASHLAPLLPVVHGSHAGGLNYVPFDGYIAELHKGERVWTAQDAYALDAMGSTSPVIVDMSRQFDALIDRISSLERAVVTATIRSADESSERMVSGVRDAVLEGSRNRRNSAGSKRRGFLST